MGIIEGEGVTNLLKKEINEELIKMPFNTALVGYSMLVDAIIVSLDPSIKKLNLSKDVYNKLAELYSVGASGVEKNIKGAISSVFNSTLIKASDIIYPCSAVKLAMNEGKPKGVIASMCQHLKLHGKYSKSI